MENPKRLTLSCPLMRPRQTAAGPETGSSRCTTTLGSRFHFRRPVILYTMS